MNTVATREINGLEHGQDSALAGQLLARRGRRRIDLKSLDGILRESAAIYKKLDAGKLSFAETEVRGRQLRRHQEILSAVEERRLIAELQEKLHSLQTARASGAQLMLDEGGEQVGAAPSELVQT